MPKEAEAKMRQIAERATKRELPWLVFRMDGAMKVTCGRFERRIQAERHATNMKRLMSHEYFAVFDPC